MTERKLFKRRVRARTEKTGERYTAARRHVVREKPDVPEDAEPAALTSEAAVLRATGKASGEWYVLLDEWGARERPHKEIARHLQEAYAVPGWWAQSVTVGYERARGLRAKHQRPDGFAVSVSKTVAAEPEQLFAAFVDASERKRLLPGAPLSVRTAQRARSARFDWGDGPSRVNVAFEARAPGKTTVFVEHHRLPDSPEAERAKAEWRERLARLKDALEK